MTLLIQRLNGTIYKLDDYGIKLIDFEVDAPKPRIASEPVEGGNGAIDMGATFEGRTMRGVFKVKAVDGYDYVLLRNEIFKIFLSKEEFYIIDLRERWKRWLVRAGSFPIKQLMHNFGEFEIEFTSNNTFAESVATTLTPFTFDSEQWGIGQGLNVDITSEDYYNIDTLTEFSILNAGDDVIDPCENAKHLLIEFTGASDELTIENLTTGEIFVHHGKTYASDVLQLNDVRVFRNGINVIDNTNMEVITILPGWNDFKITGATGVFSIKFDFRFYYV